MTLDIHTLFWVLSVMSLLSAGMLEHTWRRVWRTRFVQLAMAGSLTWGAAAAALAVQGSVPDFVSAGLANAASLLALGLWWMATRVADSRRPLGWLVIGVPVAWLLVSFAFPSDTWPAGRIAVASLLAVGWTLASWRELRSDRAVGAPARRLLRLAFACAAIVFSGRLLAALAEAPQAGLRSEPAMILALLFMVALVGAIPFLVLLLAHEQAGMADRTRLDAQLVLAESAWRELERLHRGVPAVVFRVEIAPGADPAIRYIGGDIREVTGWAARDLGALADWTAKSRSDPPAMVDAIEAALQARMSEGEFVLGRPDGTAAGMRLRLRRLSQDADGRTELIGFVIDVTHERDALARAVASARLASVGEMATGMAHELRQPLTVISCAAENAAFAIDEGDLSPDHLNAKLATIVEQAARAGEIIEYLRLFGRGDDPDAPASPVPLAEPLNGELTLVGAALRHAGITVDTALGDDPPLVLARLVPLEQVLVNLLLNARDALREQPPGRTRRIRIALEPGRAGDPIRLTVTDTAGGIPWQVFPRVFEPFVTTKPPREGAGLGLSLCYGIMRSFGGDITVSNGTEGAVFTLFFARATSANVASAPASAPIAFEAAAEVTY
jgi:signal transduction histidine kinase